MMIVVVGVFDVGWLTLGSGQRRVMLLIIVAGLMIIVVVV